MNTEKDREKFEKHFKLSENETSRITPNGEYFFTSVRHLWEGWQAAKQDEMTEEAAKEILDRHGQIERIYKNSGNPYVILERCTMDLGYLKVLVWWMENKL